MAQEQTKRGGGGEDDDAADATAGGQERREKLAEETDDLLDEIDDVGRCVASSSLRGHDVALAELANATEPSDLTTALLASSREGLELNRSVIRTHALNMGSKKFVSHYYQGIGPRTRVTRAGYSYSRMSEIIFLGSGGASRAVNWWKNSRIHCWAISNPLYTEVGAAQYNGAWVVVMARPK